jgi:hypothetical protein
MSSNLKVNTILPSTGTAIGIGTAAGDIDILGHIVGHNTPNISGINSVTANHFYGDISNATGAAAGLGTALSQDQSNPLNKLYYTDRILSIGSTVTIDHPASATGAYTQYADILVEDNADLIVADGDDLIPDILGLGGNGTTGAGGAGRLLVDNIVNRSGTGAPSFPNGAVVTGIVTATSFVGSGANLTGLPAGGKIASYAIICDQKPNGSSSGNFTSGAWRVRDLNTELADGDGIVSISNNQFTLQAGTYLIKWTCPAYGRNYHASRLRNNTDGINYAGSSTYADYNSNVQNDSRGAARLTIGAAKVFEVQHRCSVSGSHNDGFGVKTNFTTDYEIFTIVEIYKEN